MDKKVKGFKEFMKTPRQLPPPPGGHPVPPGYKRVKDHIAGWKLVKIEEGVGGALLGGIAGGIAGGPLGAVAGAYAGHKITQRSSQNKSMVDAFIANKAADVMDKRRARKAAAAGQTRFRPGAISRYLRNVAIRKSGGIYAASPDGTEPVAGFVRQKPKSKTNAPPAPHQVQQAAAPAQPVASVHPVFTQRDDSVATDLAARRKAAQRAAMARAAERVQRAVQAGRKRLPAPQSRKKPKGPSSDVIAIPEAAVTRYVHTGDYIPAGQSASRELARRPTTLARRPGTSVSVPPGSSSRYVGGERTRVSQPSKLSKLSKFGVKVGIGSLVGGVAADYAADKLGRETTAGKAAGVASDVATGAGLGAMAGSVVPIIGTGVGAGVGGVIGAGYGIYDKFINPEKPKPAATPAKPTTTTSTDSKPPPAAAAPAAAPPAAAATTKAPTYGEKGTGENVGKFWTGKSWQKPSEMSDEDRYGRTGAAIRRLDPEKYKTRPGTAQGNIELLKQLQSKGK